MLIALAYMQLFFGLLVVHDFKVQLGRVFCEMYVQMSATKAFASARTRADLSSLSVQIFTVPSLAEELCTRGGLMDSIIGQYNTHAPRAHAHRGIHMPGHTHV